MACEVHKAATCHTMAFILMEATISGVLNASLSVNFGNYVGRFRRLMYEVIKASLVFRSTPLDQAARTYKMHVLRIFCASGRKRSFKVTLLCGSFQKTGGTNQQWSTFSNQANLQLMPKNMLLAAFPQHYVHPSSSNTLATAGLEGTLQFRNGG